MIEPNWKRNCLTASDALEWARTREIEDEHDEEEVTVIKFTDGSKLRIASSSYRDGPTLEDYTDTLEAPSFFVEIPYELGLKMQADGTIDELCPETPFTESR